MENITRPIEVSHSRIKAPRTSNSRTALSLIVLLTAGLIAYLFTSMDLPITEHKEGLIDSQNYTIGNFHLIKRIQLNYTDAVITKWQSQETGLRVVHIDYETPIIRGYFSVVTEILNDSGVPHTLEHLILKGSEQFPYADSLQRVAGRYFSRMPNAYTAQDHTTYTISTAGGDSFLKMLPIYVDHILYPILKESAFMTEVFHITKEGKDAGVVYSEMQGRQNTAPDLIDLSYRRKLYPKGNGYRSETGGEMEALRELSLGQIKAYHAEYYVPNNLCILVTGRLSTQQLLEQVQNTIETRAITHEQNKGPKPVGWKRPFMDTESAVVPDLVSNTSVEVEFPAMEEKFGELTVTTIGPSPQDGITLGALSLFMEYLTGSIVAPLNKELVDVVFPYCTGISFEYVARATFVELCVSLTDVPLKHLPYLEHKLRRTIRKILKQGIDMKRLHDIIDINELSWRYNIESSGGEVFVETLLFDFIYGDDAGDTLEQQMQTPAFFKEWRSWTEKKWVDVFTRWMLEPPMLVVRARPSSNMSERLENEEKKRFEEQVTKLGEEGLERQAQLLEKAKKENDISMPDEQLAKISSSDVRSISLIPTQNASTVANSDEIEVAHPDSKELASHLEADKCSLPFALHFNHYSSRFVTISMYMSLAEIPEDMKHHLYIFELLFFSSTVTLEDGTTLKEEELIKRLDQDLLSYSFNQCNEFPEMACWSVTAEAAKYDIAIQWMRRLLWSSKSDTSRLQNRIGLIKQSIPEFLRDPETAIADVAAEVLYTSKSTSRAAAGRQLVKWIPEFERHFKRDPKRVIQELESIRDMLLKPSGLRFSILGDILAIRQPRSSWLHHFGRLEFAPLAPIPLSHETLSDLGRNPARKAYVISLPNVESSFSHHYSTGIFGYDSPEAPALSVANAVLNGPELYFWKPIRGAGLAYGVSVSMDVEEGTMEFSGYRNSDAAKTFSEAKKVVQGLVNGTIPLDALKLEAAKKSCAYGIAEDFSTAQSTAYWEFSNRVLKGRTRGWAQRRLVAIQAVTAEEVLEALRQYVLPLFDPQTSVALISCGPTQADEIARGYQEAGYEIEIRNLDDSVPWEREDKKVLTKVTDWLSEAIYSTEALAEKAQKLLRRGLAP